MPFNTQQLYTQPLELFGGLLTECDPSMAPEGSSPANQNCEYDVGDVHQRRGLVAALQTLLSGSVNYTKSYSMPTQELRTLLLDALGNFFYESVTNSPGTLTPIGFSIVTPGCYAKSNSAFGREYIAFNDQQWGLDMPRQYDGTFFDRVSQCGPGAPPVVMDDDTAYPLASIPAAPASQTGAAVAITSITQSGNLVTVVPASFPFYGINGESMVVAGVTPSTYNGTFPVTFLKNGGVFTGAFTYTLPVTGLANGTGGTVVSQAAQIDLTIGNFSGPFGKAQALAQGPIYFPIGTSVTTSGISIGGYNGTWTVIGYETWFQIVGGFNHYYLAIVVNIASTNLANGNGGQVVVNGNISAGVHQVAECFLTRQGYITKPSPTASWTAAGGKRVYVSQLAVGPPNVVARILLFTPANSNFFFYILIPTTGSLTGTKIADNTSTIAFLDFTDTTLQAAASANNAGNNLFALEELGECLGAFSYALRTVFWGERNKLQNVLNLSFDGGFTVSGALNPTTGNIPLGWQADPSGNSAGGGSVLLFGGPTQPLWGDAYGILGDGVSAVRGLITQQMVQDYLNTPIIQPNTAYSIRARVALGSLTNFAAGQLNIGLTSSQVSLAGTPGIQVTLNTITTQYIEFIAQICPALATVPNDLTLQISATGTPTAFAQVNIENIEIFPTNQPYLGQRLRLSYVDNPESFDGVTGAIGLAEAGNENIKRCFDIRETLYIQTDSGIYATSDNGSTEPSGWSVTKIANTTGTGSVTGGAGGEGWDVSAHKTGLYMFNGSEPMKMNQEIFRSVSGATIAWDQINWKKDYAIWVANDTARRQIFVGVPTGSNSTPDTILMLDYKELQTSYAIAEQGPIHTSYAGKVISWEPGRKWSPWTIPSFSGAMITRPDNTRHLFIGGARGITYDPIEGQLSDNGIAINSSYTTYAIPSQLISQQNPLLGTNRQLFSFLSLFVAGAGTLNIGTFPLALSNPGPKYSVLLSATPNQDTEVPIRVAGERCMFQVGTNAVGSWWKLSRFSVRLRRHPWSAIRHRN